LPYALLIALMAVGYYAVLSNPQWVQLTGHPSSSSSSSNLGPVDIKIQQRVALFKQQFPEDSVTAQRLLRLLKDGRKPDALVVAIIGPNAVKRAAIVDALKVVFMPATMEVRTGSAEDEIRTHLAGAKQALVVVPRFSMVKGEVASCPGDCQCHCLSLFIFCCHALCVSLLALAAPAWNGLPCCCF